MVPRLSDADLIGRPLADQCAEVRAGQAPSQREPPFAEADRRVMGPRARDKDFENKELDKTKQDTEAFKHFKLTHPRSIDLADFFVYLGARAPTAACGFFSSAKWLRKHVGIRFAVGDLSLQDSKNADAQHRTHQAVAL